ncbi:hypothetical protein D3C80_1422510 [compost metagenome]
MRYSNVWVCEVAFVEDKAECALWSSDQQTTSRNGDDTIRILVGSQVFPRRITIWPVNGSLGVAFVNRVEAADATDDPTLVVKAVIVVIDALFDAFLTRREV